MAHNAAGIHFTIAKPHMMNPPQPIGSTPPAPRSRAAAARDERRRPRQSTAGRGRAAPANARLEGMLERLADGILRRRPRLAPDLPEQPRRRTAGAARRSRAGLAGRLLWDALPELARRRRRTAAARCAARRGKRASHEFFHRAAGRWFDLRCHPAAGRHDLPFPGHHRAQGRGTGDARRQQPPAGGAGRRPPRRLALGCARRPLHAGRARRRNLRAGSRKPRSPGSSCASACTAPTATWCAPNSCARSPSTRT